MLSRLNSRTIQAFFGKFDGTPIFLFVYQIGSGDNKSDVYCVGVKSSTVRFPHLSIQPAGVQLFNSYLMHRKLWPTSRLKPVRFPEAPRFAKDYRIYAEDPDSAKRALGEEARAALARTDQLAVECRGPRFLSYKWCQARPEDEIQNFVDQSLHLCQHLSGSESI